ncbi:MAG: PAS domain-containing protein [Syntrophales bacterium]|nr:PAS domain-containing protein [Syntrophales bacterium]
MPPNRRKTSGDRWDHFEIRNRIAAILLTVDDDRMYGKVMDVVRDASESPFGVFAYIDDDGFVVAPSLSRNIGEDHLQSEIPIRFSPDSWGDTAWGIAVRRKQSVISNRPGGILHGDIPITRALVAPIIFQEKVLGFLKLANRSTDYNDRDRKNLEKLANFIGPPLHSRLDRNRRERNRDKIEEVLLKSKSRLTALMGNSTGMAYQCLNEPDGTMLFVGGECRELTGYDVKDFISGSVRLAFLVHDHDVGRVWEEIRTKLHKKLPFESIYRIRSRDSGSKWVWEQGRGLYDDDGKLVAVEGFISDISELKHTEEENRKSYSQIKSMAARIEGVREEERRKLARTLHDDLGQTLAGLRFDLYWLLKKIPENQACLRDKIRTMMEYVEPAISKVRSIYTELRPWILEELGLIDAIEYEIDSFKLRSCLRVEFETRFDFDEHSLSREEKTAIYRIIQEALKNIYIHSEATRVRISLTENGAGVRLRIQDNGKGFLSSDLKKPSSSGVMLMKERIAILGGIFELSGNPGRGTMLTAEIPAAGPAVCGRYGSETTGRVT